MREIRKKMLMLTNRMPFQEDVKSYIQSIEKKEWIFNNLRLSGSSITLEQIDTLLNGELLLNMPIQERLTMERLAGILPRLYDYADSGQLPSLAMVERLHRLLCPEDKECQYRKRNLIMEEWDYTPVIPAYVPAKMAEFKQLLASAIETREGSEEVLDMAAKLHNYILAVMPYGEEDGLLARVFGAYYLVYRGFPVLTFSLKEQEYNQLVTYSLRTGDSQPMKEAIKNAISERLELMIQLTRL